MGRKDELAEIIRWHGGDRTRLLDIFWDAQASPGFISDDDLEFIASGLRTSVSDLREVLSFYHFFRSTPSGRFQIYLDQSIIAEMSGMAQVRSAFEAELGISVGQVTEDGLFGLFETSCIGMSDQSPAALINSIPFTKLNPDRVKKMISRLRQGEDPQALIHEFGLGEGQNAAPGIGSTVVNNIRTRDGFFFSSRALDAGWRAALARSPEEVIAQIERSGLRGRGGAGFPTGRKWAACRASQSQSRFVVCNADEGEPGTFKDRVLLTETPERVIEGMAIAARAIGASECVLYLRAEYRYLKDHIQNNINAFVARNAGLRFQFRIQLGAGAYVCGEESALLESMEGKRGEPRLKPPFPVEVGYLGQPTVVNNVETFVLAAEIMWRGAEAFRALGTERSPGVRLLSISGDVSRPGVYEVPWGIRIGEVLDLCGAVSPKMVQVGGPSGACVRADEVDRRVSYEDLPTGGSLMVFDQTRDVLGVAENFMQFFVDESCGNCTPCRAGNVVMRDLLKRFSHGHARREDLAKVDEWARIISTSSRCGLGQSSPHIVSGTKRAFPEVYSAKIDPKASDLFYDFDLAAATVDYDRTIKELK